MENGPSKICGAEPLKIWSDMVYLNRTITQIFSKAVFHKFYLVHSWIPCLKCLICHNYFTKPLLKHCERALRRSYSGKGVLKICSNFTGEHQCQSEISIKLPRNFIEITLRDGCSPVNLLHIFRTLFSKNEHLWVAASEHSKQVQNLNWRNWTGFWNTLFL